MYTVLHSSTIYDLLIKVYRCITVIKFEVTLLLYSKSDDKNLKTLKRGVTVKVLFTSFDL